MTRTREEKIAMLRRLTRKGLYEKIDEQAELGLRDVTPSEMGIFREEARLQAIRNNMGRARVAVSGVQHDGCRRPENVRDAVRSAEEVYQSLVEITGGESNLPLDALMNISRGPHLIQEAYEFAIAADLRLARESLGKNVKAFHYGNVLRWSSESGIPLKTGVQDEALENGASRYFKEAEVASVVDVGSQIRDLLQ